MRLIRRILIADFDVFASDFTCYIVFSNNLFDGSIFIYQLLNFISVFGIEADE